MGEDVWVKTSNKNAYLRKNNGSTKHKLEKAGAMPSFRALSNNLFASFRAFLFYLYLTFRDLCVMLQIIGHIKREEMIE